MSGFLEEVALVADIDSLDEDQEYVVLMTLHSAKGLEFPRVYLDIGLYCVSPCTILLRALVKVSSCSALVIPT